MSTYNSVLIECSDDYVGLWSILRDIYEDNPQIEPLEARQKTLELIEKLMHEDLIQPGMFAENSHNIDKFELWNLSPKETILLIETEWLALEREPTIGEIVWFITTEKGNKKLESIIEN